MKPYHFLPDIQHAVSRADDAEHTAETLGEFLAQALEALAAHDVSTAQQLRGAALQRARGRLPRVAMRLSRIPLEYLE